MDIKSKIIKCTIEYWIKNFVGITIKKILNLINVNPEIFYNELKTLKIEKKINYQENNPDVIFPSENILIEYFNNNISKFNNNGEYTNRLIKGQSQIKKIYFDCEVLNKYQKNIEKYIFSETILGGIINSKNNNEYFRICFGKKQLSNNIPAIFVELWYLNTLPLKEQKYWESFELNELTFKKVDENYIKYNKIISEGEFVEIDDPINSITHTIHSINEILNCKIFKTTSNIHITYPKINNYKTFCECCSELYILLGPDNLSERTIKDILRNIFKLNHNDLINNESGRNFSVLQLFYLLLEKYKCNYQKYKKLLLQLKDERTSKRWTPKTGQSCKVEKYDIIKFGGTRYVKQKKVFAGL